VILLAVVALGQLTRTAAPHTDSFPANVSLQAADLPAFVPGLVLWLDGADPATRFADLGGTIPAGTGDAVARWNDKSLRANHATRDDPTARPVLTATGPHTVPGFDGGDSLALDAAKLPTGTNASTAFVVARPDSTGTRAAFVHGSDSSGEFRWFGAEGSRSRSVTASSTANPSTAAWPAAGAGLMTGRFAAATGTVWADGGDEVSAGGVFITGATYAQVGANNGLQHWTGPIHEILVYDRALTDQERRSVETWLARKWGVDLAPTAPGSPTATASGDRAVTVAWAAPSDTGGAAITDYEIGYRPQGATTWAATADGVSTATTATITGLTSTTAYEFRVAARNARGRSVWTSPVSATALAAWTPADLAGGLALWLDADAAGTMTLDAPGAVSAWRDRSGSGRDASQSGTARPTRTATINGRAAVSFDGADDYLALAAPLPLANTGGFDVAVVAAPELAGTNGTWGTAFLRQQPGGDAAGSWFAGYRADGRTTVVHHRVAGDNGAGTVLGGPVIVDATPQLFGYAFDATGGATSSTQWALRQAGAQLAVTTAPTATGWNTGNGEVGRSSTGGGYYLRGRVGEIVVTSGTLSSADRAQLEGYLAHRWGLAASLPADHPYRSVPPLIGAPATGPGAPASVTVTPGDATLALTWSAPATGGSPLRDYRVEYRATPSGDWTLLADGVSTATAATISGLTNGVAYDVRVSAVNAVGAGPASPVQTVRPGGLPAAPVGVTATAGSGSLGVRWSLPATDGGSAITRYTATASPGGASCTADLAAPIATRNDPDNGGWVTSGYGTLGSVLGAYDGATDRANLPAGVSYTKTSTIHHTWAASTNESRAVQDPAGGSRRATAWYNSAAFSQTFTFATGAQRLMRIYVLDWDGANARAQTVSVTVDGVTRSVHVSAFSAGRWIDVPISVRAGGTVTITTTRTAGGNGVISGVFFDPPPLACTIDGLTPGTGYEVTVTATNAAGTGPRGGATVPAGLGASWWLDAADPATRTVSGTAVSEWRDKSGNGRHAGQGTATAQPAVAAAAMHGLDVIRFDGSDRLQTAAFSAVPAGSSDVSLVTVHRVLATSGYGTVVGNYPSGNLQMMYGFAVAPYVNPWGLWLNTQVPSTPTPSTAVTGRTYLTGAVRAGGQITMFTGASQTNVASNTQSLGGATAWSLGANTAGGEFGTVDIAETIVVPSALGTVDRQRLEGYLAHKWGLTADLPAGHPYRTVPPGAVATPYGLPGAPTGPLAAPTSVSTAASGFQDPYDAAVAFDGSVYLADFGGNRIVRVGPTGDVATFAGSGSAGGTNGTGTAASFHQPIGVAVAPNGDLIVSEYTGARVRRITPSGVVTTVASLPANGWGVTVAPDDTIYVALEGSSVVRITPGGVVSPVRDADGAPLAFNRPAGVAVDLSGNLIVSEYNGHRLRVVSPSGVVSTLAGSGGVGATDGEGATATFSNPAAIDIDRAGNVYVPDHTGHRIRRVTPGGAVATIAGTGTAGTADRPGSGATFSGPVAVAVAGDGTVVVTETGNDRLRRIARMGDGALALAWSAPADTGGAPVLDYLIDYRISPDGAWTRAADGVSAATSATVGGLTNGVAYDLRVSAVNAAGTGATTATVTATPAAVPAAPTGLTLSTTSGSISAAWSAPVDTGGSPLTQFIVEHRLSPTGIWSRTAAATSTSATIGGLADGSTYDVRVVAANAVGAGAPSPVATVTVLGPAPALERPPGSAANLVFCRYASDCSGLSGSPGALTYQFSFTGAAGGSYRVQGLSIDATSTSWTTGSELGGLTFTSPTPGVTVSGTTVAVGTTGTVVVTISGVPANRTFVAAVTRTSGETDISSTAHTDALGVYTGSGTHAFHAPVGGEVSYLVVAGGGGGANDAGGGGGAGGVLSGRATLLAGPSTITVGAGGTRSTGGPATNGGDSSALGLTAVGGGRGAAEAISDPAQNDARTGGSGGGGGALAFSTGKVLPGQAGVAGQGNAGGDGNGLHRGNGGIGGGGGGAGEPGNTDGQGAGGDGAPAALAGTVVIYGGGGAGNNFSNTLATGLGGTGGGGSSLNGATVDGGLARKHGRPNTGGGGASQSGAWGVPGDGGSGLVIVRRSDASPATAPGLPDAVATATSVSLTWSASSAHPNAPVVDYRIELRAAGTDAWRTFDDGVSTATSATVTGLTTGTTYDFRVRALSAAGPGAPSSTRTVATYDPAPALATPVGATENLVFCSAAADCTALAGAPGARSYQFAFVAAGGAAYELLAFTIDATSTSWTTGPALAGVAYTTPTAGASLSGNMLSATSAGLTTVTATGVPSDQAVFFGVRRTLAGNPASALALTDIVAAYTTTGAHTLYVPAPASVDYLVVGGGGDGGRGSANSFSYGGGGGGGGGVASGNTALGIGTIAVTVGPAGGGSAFAAVSVLGGGTGGTGANPLSGPAGSPTVGASGGGGADGGSNCAGAAGTTGQGFAGGNGACSGGSGGAGGGGGGAGGSGGAASGTTVGAGGLGLARTITGRSVFYARGGAGGSGSVSAAGAAGAGNSGNGGTGGSTRYTGATGAGGPGGTGIVIIRLRR
jgi:hypothetical protein